MNISNLSEKDLDLLIELYLNNRNKFIGICTLEDFFEQFCHKCDTCGRLICILDMCEECDVIKEENEFQEFELNKEYYVYGL